MKNKRLKISRRLLGFSLVEVVVAVGVFGIAVVALLGVLSATSKTVSGLSDGNVAAKIAANIEAELRRYAATQTDFDTFASNADGLVLFATRDGERVLVSTAADANIDGTSTSVPTGIPRRDRYYRVRVNRMAAPLDYSSGDGFVALSVIVDWPYQLPLGPALSGNSTLGTEGTDYSVTPDEDRTSYLLNLAITP